MRFVGKPNNGWITTILLEQMIHATDQRHGHHGWTQTVSATIAVVGIGAASYYSWKKIRESLSVKSKRYPPFCPTGLLGTVDAFANGGIREFLITNFERCGKIYRVRLIVPGAPMVVIVANSQDAREIVKDPKTVKPQILYNVMDRFSSGPSIVSLHGGDDWFHRRKGMNPSFAPKRIRAMNEVALQVATEWVTEMFRPILQGKQSEVSFDVGKEMIDITISVICQAALDYRVSREERQSLLEEIPLAWTEFTMKDAMNPFRRFFTHILPERQRAFTAARKIKEFAFRVIENYRKNPTPAAQTVVDMVMKNPNYKSDDERAADIIMILFAGHDTTGYTLALGLLELAKHSDEQSRLRQTLGGRGGEARKREESSLAPPSAQLDSSPYLRAVISETMRMYPVVSAPGIKTIGRDFVTQHGNYFIPKGSIVFIAQIAIARDPAIFENPFDYKPSRWLNATEEAKLSLFPFALGNRNCIGQPLANAELYTILPYLIKNFELTVEQEGTITCPSMLRIDNCRLIARKVQ